MVAPKVVWLGVADAPNSFVTRGLEEVQLGFEGIAGDRHAGLTMKAGVRQKYVAKGTEIRNFRQLSLLSVEELDVIAREMGVPVVDGAWLGANLVLQGIAKLTQLPASTRLKFPSGAVIAIDCDNLPCRNPGRMVAHHFPEGQGLDVKFVKASMNRRGLVGWVEAPGVIRRGDEVAVLLRKDRG